MENASFKRDDLTRKIVQKAGMEQPSYSFTSGIMERIRLSRSPGVFLYQPVISSKTWWMLGAVLVTMLLLFMYMPASQSPVGAAFTKYISPANDALNNAASGFFEKFSLLRSFSWVAVVLLAGWLVFAADKMFRKMRLSE